MHIVFASFCKRKTKLRHKKVHRRVFLCKKNKIQRFINWCQVWICHCLHNIVLCMCVCMCVCACVYVCVCVCCVCECSSQNCVCVSVCVPYNESWIQQLLILSHCCCYTRNPLSVVCVCERERQCVSVSKKPSLPSSRYIICLFLKCTKQCQLSLGKYSI